MASYELQTKIAACFAGSAAATAAAIKTAPFFKGRGQSLVKAAIDEVATGESPVALYWGKVRAALETEAPKGPLNPLEAVLGGPPVPPSALKGALEVPEVAKKATKKAAKKSTKKVDRSQPVYRAAHAAAKGSPSAAAYKAAYNAFLASWGVAPYYA